MIIADYINIIVSSLENLYNKYEANAIAKLYLCDKLQLSNKQFVISKFQVVDDTNLQSFDNDIRRLSQGEPVQYVIGKTEFYDSTFIVDSNVLIPRQETEIIVDIICKENKYSQKSILDIGCGSGCIAISIQKNCCKSVVYAIDISKPALSITQQNAKNNNVNIFTAEYDILSNAQLPFYEPFDIVVSNPPYVRKSEIELMHKNVTDYEPALALYVEDNDPLIYYRKILQLINKHQPQHRTEILFEINEALGSEIVKLLEHYFYSNIVIINDLNNKQRFVRAKIN